MTFASGLEDLRTQVPFLSLATQVPRSGHLLVRPIASGILVYTQWVNAVSDSGSAVVVPYRSSSRFDSRDDVHTGKYGPAKVVREYLVYVRGVSASLIGGEGSQGGEDIEDDAMVLTLTLNRASILRDYLTRYGLTLSDIAFKLSRITTGNDKGKYDFAIERMADPLDDETIDMGPVYQQRLEGLCQDLLPNSSLPSAPYNAPYSSPNAPLYGDSDGRQSAIVPTHEPSRQHSYLLGQLLQILDAYNYEEVSVIASIQSRGIDLDLTILEFEDLLSLAILRWVGLQTTSEESFNEVLVRGLIGEIDWTSADWSDQVLSQGSVINPWTD